MRISGITHESMVDGPGLRVVVFMQGCTIGCPECHNPDSHSIAGGKEYTVREVMRMMQQKKGKPWEKPRPLQGVTFSGGEPFLQAGDVALLAMEAKRIGWDVTTFTGYTYEELIIRTDAGVVALLTHTDYLVDGPYIHELRDLDLKFRGSTNQRVIDMNATRKSDKIKLSYFS